MNTKNKAIVAAFAVLVTGGGLGLLSARGGGFHGGGFHGGGHASFRGGGMRAGGHHFAGRGTTAMAGRRAGPGTAAARRGPMAARHGGAHPQAMRHGGAHHHGAHHHGHDWHGGRGGYWGWGWGWGLGLGLGAWFLLEPYWWQYQWWGWPYGGINVIIDGTEYKVADAATKEELQEVLDAAKAASDKNRAELASLKSEFVNVQNELEKTTDEAVKDAQEELASVLEQKIEALGAKLKERDTKVIGPISTKLGNYQPTGLKQTATSDTTGGPIREHRKAKDIEKEHSWSDTEVAAEGLKVTTDEELMEQGLE